LTKWPVNPDFVDKWKGTVAVMRRDPEGLGTRSLSAQARERVFDWLLLEIAEMKLRELPWQN
jgi:hypothetical protein